MKKMIVVMMFVACTASGLFANPTALSEDRRFETVEPLPLTCTITIKGKYGDTPVDLTITVEADNCARAAGEFLKAFVAKK